MRQSVTRIEKAGYTFSMETLSDVGDETMAELERVSDAWRAGADERGFTMALERLGGAQQHETVVAIARDDEGHVRGFLHFVPSYGRPAVSLSFMRRDPETPNGLTEFLVARSIEALRARGIEEVSLNFAAFARLLTEPENLLERAAARVLRWADAWFQIESLYRFNAKFDPRWEPRYVLYEGRLGPGPRGARRSVGRGPDPEAAGPPMRLPAARRPASWSPLRIGVFVLAGVALLLPAWALYLAVALPREHVAPNWDVVWVGLDLGLARSRRPPCSHSAAALRGRRSRRGAGRRARLRRVVRRADLRRERPPVRRRPGACSRSCRLPSSPPWSVFARCRRL